MDIIGALRIDLTLAACGLSGGKGLVKPGMMVLNRVVPGGLSISMSASESSSPALYFSMAL